MSDVIDLSAERDRRNGPDEKFVTTDPEGRTMFAFCFDYQMAGSTFILSVFAFDFEDAELRCAAIRESLVVAGQIYTEIPG